MPIYGGINIQGIGCFKSKPINQFLGSEGGLLLPPSHRIQLTEIDDNFPFLLDAAEADQLISKKKRKKVQKEMERKVNDILNLGKTDIGDLGTICLSVDGRLYFESSFEQINEANRFLPPIEITPISKNKKAILIPPWPRKSGKVGTVSEFSGSRGGQLELMREYLFPFLSIIVFTLIFVFLLKKVFDEPEVTQFGEPTAAVVLANSGDLEHPGKLMKMEDADTSWNNAAEDEEKMDVEQSTQVECVIIVGSFVNPQNVDRMVGRIQAAGELPYTEMTKGNIQRVGIQFSCSDYDPQVYLSSVRNRYDTKSWFRSIP